jgi:hypothetical protein
MVSGRSLSRLKPGALWRDEITIRTMAAIDHAGSDLT